MTSNQKIPAISCRQWLVEWDQYPFPADHERTKPPENLIVFSMPARLLRKLAGVYVRKREGAVATGIQRTHEKDRSNKISEYVKAGYPFGDLSKKQKTEPENNQLKKPGWLPTAIVVNILKPGEERRGKQVATKDLVQVNRVGNGSALEIEIPENVSATDWMPEGFSPIEVIDGQHRLFAFDESSELPEDFELPVVAFHGLDMGWQAYLFWSINVSPKKINPSHAYDLFPLLRTQDWLEAAPSAHVYREARSQELTELLYRHSTSPWHSRINMLGERKSGWVSQAGWVQAIFNSFFSLGTTGRGRKGLFASNLSQTMGPLEWSRPQQAAFLIFLWKCLQEAIKAKAEGWPTDLREENGQQIDFEDKHDLAFAGQKTLLNQEQGVRGFSLALNDLLWTQAVQLGLHTWACEDIDGGETRDADIDACLNSIEREAFADPIRKIIACLAEFDWRSFDAKGLTKEQSQLKAGYRGTGGYSRIRLSLLELIAQQPSDLGIAARNLLISQAA
jgi:DGQHR domain-containing protein